MLVMSLYFGFFVVLFCGVIYVIYRHFKKLKNSIINKNELIRYLEKDNSEMAEQIISLKNELSKITEHHSKLKHKIQKEAESRKLLGEPIKEVHGEPVDYKKDFKHLNLLKEIDSPSYTKKNKVENSNSVTNFHESRITDMAIGAVAGAAFESLVSDFNSSGDFVSNASDSGFSGDGGDFGGGGSDSGFDSGSSGSSD